MNPPMAEALTRYLTETMGLKVSIEPHRTAKDLPQFIRQRYELFDLKADGRRFLLVRPKDAKSVKPATLEKHLRRIPLGDAEGSCILTGPLPGYVRKRLIERRLAFVIPGHQIYWPALGTVVQPRGAGPKSLHVDDLGPATQAVVLLALTGHLPEPVTPKDLARQLGYSAMTMTRALDEIESSGLGQVTRQGRRRVLSFGADKRTLWRRARPLMRSPVKREIAVPEASIPAAMRLPAGETALAAKSNLAAPKTAVYAIGPNAWKRLQARGVEPIPLEEERPDTCVIQIWRYDPKPLAEGGCVDVFSLILSLQEVTDERVEAALDKAMEAHQW